MGQLVIDLARIDEQDDSSTRHGEEAHEIENPLVADVLPKAAGKAGTANDHCADDVQLARDPHVARRHAVGTRGRDHAGQRGKHARQ